MLAALNNADEDDSSDQSTSKEPGINHDTIDKYILLAVGQDSEGAGNRCVRKENSSTNNNMSAKLDYIENDEKNLAEDEAGWRKVPDFAKGAFVHNCLLHQAESINSKCKRPSTRMASPIKNQDETPAKKTKTA